MDYNLSNYSCYEIVQLTYGIIDHLKSVPEKETLRPEGPRHREIMRSKIALKNIFKCLQQIREKDDGN